MRDNLPILVTATARNQHDQLLLNAGNLLFVDVSRNAGVESLAGLIQCPVPGQICRAADAVPIEGNPAGITWGVAAADVDLDGDVDLMTANDQGGLTPVGEAFFPPLFPILTNVNRGLIHVFLNDGTGQFTDVPAGTTEPLAPGQPGSWMGLTYCDFNHDGHMDFFGTNFGDINISIGLGMPLLGFQTSRWFFGNGDGTFNDPGRFGEPLPGLNATPFGWGASAVDYDNDGDCDITYVGNLSVATLIYLDNPVAFLENDGSGTFSRDVDAMDEAETQRQRLRVKHGMATGDLNRDGFVDIVSVSTHNVPLETTLPGPNGEPPLTFLNPFGSAFGGPWDEEALVSAVFAPSPDVPGSFFFIPALLDYPDGDLSIQLNSADNGHHWVVVEALGTVGLTSQGMVNRDGVGAVVFFTPNRGQQAIKPVVAGSSYASQHSLQLHFGLGERTRGRVDILWPGGTRNRLYHVRASEHLVFPEIPCDFTAEWPNRAAYRTCVDTALDELTAAGVITSQAQRARFLSSALRAFDEP